MREKICYSVTAGSVFFPERFPKSGELIKVNRNFRGYFQNIIVGDNWHIRHRIQVFDMIIFVFGNEEIVFQIRPTLDPIVGILVFIKRSRLQSTGWSKNWYHPSSRLRGSG